MEKTRRTYPGMNLESANRGAASGGKSQMLRHIAGEDLTKGEAIEAKCFDCMGGYADGRIDCQMPHCALYPWMPYKEGGPRIKSRPWSPERSAKQREILKRVRTTIHTPKQ